MPGFEPGSSWYEADKTAINCQFNILFYPSKVSGGSHAVEILLSFWRVDPCTGQLSIIDLDVVTFHRLLHRHQRVGRYLQHGQTLI